MTKYIVQDVQIEAGGDPRKQFYRSVGMQDFDTGEFVEVREWAGEHTLVQLERDKVQILSQLAEIEEKISFFG